MVGCDARPVLRAPIAQLGVAWFRSTLDVISRLRLIPVLFVALVLFVAPRVAGPREVLPTADLLVVGATPAGIATAVTAARAGEHVVLSDGGWEPGGALTGAMMDQWDFNVGRRDAPLQRGFFSEIHARLGDEFTPASARRAFVRMLAAQRRISLFYGELPASVATIGGRKGRRIDAVMFRNVRTSRLRTLRVAAIVDATDGGDVAALAGARYDVGRQDTGIDEREQAVTEIFTLAGVNWRAVRLGYDTARFGQGGATLHRVWGYAKLLRRYRPAARNVVVPDLNLGAMPNGQISANAIDVCGIDGLAPRSLTRAKRETEREAPRLLRFLRKNVPGFARARIADFAPNVYVRETRHISGLGRLTASDIWGGRIPSDSVALASYPIDLHPVQPADKPAFATERHVYGIPFGALIPRGFTNLLLASPAISASHVAAGSVRTIPTTIEEGQADALISVLAHRTGLTFVQLAAQPRRLSTVRRTVDASPGPSRPA